MQLIPQKSRERFFAKSVDKRDKICYDVRNIKTCCDREKILPSRTFREPPDGVRRCAGPDALALELPAERSCTDYVSLLGADGFSTVTRGVTFGLPDGKVGAWRQQEWYRGSMLSFLALQGTKAFLFVTETKGNAYGTL